MEQFIQKHEKNIIGVLSGWDRLVLRGTLRALAVACGMMDFLSRMGVGLSEFGAYVQETSDQLKQGTYAAARRLCRPNLYVAASGASKEQLARDVADRDGITAGLICLLRCVEPCMTYQVYGNRSKGRYVLERRVRKCLYVYHYWIDPLFGFMSARIQTWFPFSIQVCLNGREWLARQMDRARLAYERRGNCFVWLENVAQAQHLMAAIFRVSWPQVLREVARRLNPAHDEIFRSYRIDYYWSVHQSEWATDILFRSAKGLASIYTPLVRESIALFSSQDVMRFLGKKMNPNFAGQVVSQYRRRPEGVRVKHAYKSNSVKVYDKQGSVLRVETTINNPGDFRVFRPKEGDSQGPRAWRKMRKGIADLYRRAQVSHASNQRYLEALASLDTHAPLAKLILPVCQPRIHRGHRVRGLRPWSAQDRALLQAIGSGEFVIQGFRNRDLVARLYPESRRNPCANRRASSRVTRALRMLRQHRVICKIQHTHRYRLTRKGRQIVLAILRFQELTVHRLNAIAA